MISHEVDDEIRESLDFLARTNKEIDECTQALVLMRRRVKTNALRLRTLKCEYRAEKKRLAEIAN